MNTTTDSVTETPSLHDLHSDANVRTSGFDERMFDQPDDAFPMDAPPSEDELDRMERDAADMCGVRATVLELWHVNHMGGIVVQDDTGRRISMTDLACAFAYCEPGTTGTAWLDATGHWNFTRDRTAADDAAEAFIKACDEYELTRPRKPWEPIAEPRPITQQVRKLDPAAWGVGENVVSPDEREALLAE